MNFSRQVFLGILVGIFMGAVAMVPAGAQVTTADVVGRVTDARGAVLPGAMVTLTNLGTNISRRAIANETGDYVVNLLPIGRYSVRMEVAGFKSFNVAELTLAAGDRARVDAKLEVGQTSETVEITAELPILQTEQSSTWNALT